MNTTRLRATLIAAALLGACSDDGASGDTPADPSASWPPAAQAGAGTPTPSGAQPTPAGSSASPAPSTTPTDAPAPAQAGAGAPATTAGDGMQAPSDDPAASGAGAGEPAPGPGVARLPPVDAVDAMGPFEVTIERDQSPGGGWVAHPTELGRDGLLHPIFVWGCGGGSQPSQYEDHLTRIASHGFVMEAHVSTGDAADHDVPLEWLLAQNEDPGSPYYQKLDTSKIAAGGHSMGSIATFAFEGDTDRLTTSIHVAGGSFDGNGYLRIKTPTLMVGGVNDTLAGANTSRDFERVTMPAFYANIEDTDHLYAARNGLPPIVAWLRWQLGGEEERSSMFLGDDCDFCGGIWNGMAKNW